MKTHIGLHVKYPLFVVRYLYLLYNLCIAFVL